MNSRYIVIVVGLIAGCNRFQNDSSADVSRTNEQIKKQLESSKIESTQGQKIMSEEIAWTEESQAELRDTIRREILGRIRLAQRDHDQIANDCYEIYLMDDCPEEELPAWKQFVSDEIKKLAAAEVADQKSWPAFTDCDRLDKAEAALRERGILLWQASPCCDSCTYGEFPERIEALEKRYPGIKDKLRGYAFFIDQNLPESLADNRQTSVYLGYGWKVPEDQKPSQEEYEKQALSIANEVCAALREEGLMVDWDGTMQRKIGFDLLWQRRKPLQ
jgi:hypothetical protein